MALIFSEDSQLLMYLEPDWRPWMYLCMEQEYTSFQYISSRCNPAVEYNVAVFSELSFAARWQGRLSRG